MDKGRRGRVTVLDRRRSWIGNRLVVDHIPPEIHVERLVRKVQRLFGPHRETVVGVVAAKYDGCRRSNGND